MQYGLEELRTLRDRARSRMDDVMPAVSEAADRFSSDPSAFSEWQSRKISSLAAIEEFEKANTAYLEAKRSTSF